MSTRKSSAKGKHESSPKAPPTSKPQLQDLLDVRTCLSLLDENKLDDARELCDAVLKRAPQLVFAQNARGLIAMRGLDFPSAENYLKKAVDADPGNSEYMTNLGNAILKQDRIDDAIKTFEQAIEFDTENQSARIGLANALHEKNDPDASIAYFEDAVRRAPDAPGPLSHLGRAQIAARRFNEAVTTVMKSLELDISFAPAHTALGEAFYGMELYKESLEAHKTALLLDPQDIYAHNKIADTYIKLDQPAQANEHYQRVIEIAPKDPNSYVKLGTALASNEDRLDEAIVQFKKALELDPRHALTYNNAGAVLHDNGHPAQAVQYLRQALALKPNYATAQHNLALIQLLFGHLKEGWELHESRLVTRERAHVYKMIHKLFGIIPKWDGKSSLAGKHILLMHEQGFGDSIQFLRYVRLLQDRGATVALHVKDPLYRLFKSFTPHITLVREKDPLPKCDCSYVLMSLPHALGTDTVEDIPAFPHYLSADDVDKQQWKKRLDTMTAPNRLRVGFVWGGNPEHGNDRRRSIPLEKMLPLFNTPGIDFFSLQKGKPTPDLKKLPRDLPVFDIGLYCNDFADTAAAIANMDLVISVDTSVVHLAGALGAPTWIMLAHTPDWRWLMDREDTPWYPSMRLFRQPAARDWERVIERIQTEISLLRDQKNAQQ